MAGQIHQINVSPGGVPKLPVPEAYLAVTGVFGDAQADTVHHGGPDRAVCLYSWEVIEALRREGHPIGAGSAGENLTLAGIDWRAVGPGTVLRIGSALIEVTHPTTPCYKNARWFIDGNFTRMHPAKHPGWSRMYARILEEGWVRRGDSVAVIEKEATA